jgi:serine/threonine-protein kinase HipA
MIKVVNKNRHATILVQGISAATFEQAGEKYIIHYLPGYKGAPISLTMPIEQGIYVFSEFPPFFDGVLPEGPQLEALLKQAKLDRNDYFGQLLQVGHDLVGAVTIEASDD